MFVMRFGIWQCDTPLCRLGFRCALHRWTGFNSGSSHRPLFALIYRVKRRCSSTCERKQNVASLPVISFTVCSSAY